MNKFIVHFIAPAGAIDEWMKTPEEQRKVEEQKMREQWDAWTEAHKDLIKETISVGKPKKVTSSGTEDSRNDLMMYSIVEAESHEAAAKAFEGHPHFTIPGASIEVMSMRPM